MPTLTILAGVVPLCIRAAAPADANVLVVFNDAMALETEDKRLDRATLDRGVRALLADPGRGFYLVAERGGAIVGQLMVTFEWSDWRNAWFWWIQSVYVAADARRTGVYRALHNHLVELAKHTPGVCGVRLYVDAHNARAQATYAALGMTRARYHLFELEF